MGNRIDEELALLRERWPDLRYVPEGQWTLLPGYGPLPDGWSLTFLPVVFQIQTAHPGTPPYGFYVPVGIQFRGQRPNNYTEPAGTQPPFGSSWGIFSWQPDDGQWQPKADVTSGSNLLNWALGIMQRLREGL